MLPSNVPLMKFYSLLLHPFLLPFFLPALAPAAETPGNAATAQTPAPLNAAWTQAASFLTNESNQEFTRSKGLPGIDERERELGEAVTLLNVQPRTSGNIERARTLFKKLGADASSNDDTSIFARFFLARIDENYDDPPQPEAARKLYRELVEHHAGNPLAEAGAASLVLLDLYENIPTDERARRFDELEKLAPLLKTPSGRRDYQLNMGNAYVDFPEIAGAQAKALEHLQAADKEGISRWQSEALAWIAIGELARAENRNDLAAEYYGKFLAKYKRDNRHFTIQKALESLTEAKK